ncbi:hypothetical protein HDU97_001861 [Phlyctochytrium planicorne]|nr:hypothetical protein HDU97_001861 [Phlyctochytrium planicorne]
MAETQTDQLREQTGQMRLTSLGFWHKIASTVPSCQVKMVDGELTQTAKNRTQVKCKLESTDAEMSVFNVKDLETPVGVYERASLRSGDVKYFVVDL